MLLQGGVRGRKKGREGRGGMVGAQAGWVENRSTESNVCTVQEVRSGGCGYRGRRIGAWLDACLCM